MQRTRKERLVCLLFLALAASPLAIAKDRANWNTAWKPTRIDPQAQHALDNPSSMTLFSIDPSFRSPNAFLRFLEDISYRHLHWWRVLGQVNISETATQKRVATSIERAVHDFNGWRALCFNPRHAVRVTSGSQTYDFVICYECSSLEVFAGDRQLGSVSMSGSSRMLDELLKAAHIKLAK